MAWLNSLGTMHVPLAGYASTVWNAPFFDRTYGWGPLVIGLMTDYIFTSPEDLRCCWRRVPIPFCARPEGGCLPLGSCAGAGDGCGQRDGWSGRPDTFGSCGI